MSATDQTMAPPARPGKNDIRARHGFWRTNVEAFTVAIIMALIIKQFAFEAFQVPTESMEPTIIGRKTNGDRIIVNKFSYQVSEPQRWQVVVFRYPLSGLVNYVKRLVGLPDETVSIVEGDIYVAPHHGKDFTVARKPADLQDAIFLKNPVIPLEATENFKVNSFKDWWEIENANSAIDQKKGVLELDAGSAERLVRSKDRLTIERRDPDAADRSSRADAQLGENVGDLRLAVEVEPAAGAGALIMEIRDCTQPLQPIRLELAVEGGAERSSLKHGDEEIASGELAGFKLPAGESREILLDNVDDTIRLTVEGEEVFKQDYVQAMERGTRQISQVAFGLTRGKAVFRRVAVYRDLYYTSFADTPHAPFAVPEGHYFFLGDNSPNSLDARGWRVVGIRLRDTGEVLLGDLEAVSDEIEAQRRESNPWIEHGEAQFIDVRGNHWNLAGRPWDLLDLKAFDDDQDVGIMALHGRILETPPEGGIAHEDVSLAFLGELTAHGEQSFKPFSRLMHYVPRSDIVGRAFFVFWPIDRIGVIR